MQDRERNGMDVRALASARAGRSRAEVSARGDGDLANDLSFQLRAAGIKHEREVMLIPDRKFRTDIVIGFLAIEVDGATWIGGRHSRGYGIQADCEKQNSLVCLGYRPMRFTRKMVKDGTALQMIERAMGVAA